MLTSIISKAKSSQNRHSSCHLRHTERAIPLSLALRLSRIRSTDYTFTLRTNELMTYTVALQTWLQPTDIFSDKKSHAQGTSPAERSAFTKACYRHRYRQIWMRCIHTNIQASSPLRLVHHSQTHEHFNLIPSCLHILLPCNAATTSPHFLYELNYATLHETTHTQRFFSMWHSFFFVHLHIQQTYFLHIPLHSRNKTCHSPHYQQLKKPYLHDSVQTLCCHKQYMGETKKIFKDRINEHRRPVDMPTNISKRTTVSEHFLTDHQTINDISLIPLEYRKLEKHISSQKATRFSL